MRSSRNCGAAQDAAQATRICYPAGHAARRAEESAVAAIATGDYARAQALLEQAFDGDLVAARKAQDAANKAPDTANQRYVTAAKTKADLGLLKLSQLQYEAASRDSRRGRSGARERAAYPGTISGCRRHGGDHRTHLQRGATITTGDCGDTGSDRQTDARAGNQNEFVPGALTMSEVTGTDLLRGASVQEH